MRSKQKSIRFFIQNVICCNSAEGINGLLSKIDFFFTYSDLLVCKIV